MISDKNRLVEGVTSFIGGANSSVDPSLLPPSQYSWSRNVVIRGGFPRSRPGFRFVKAIPDGVIQTASYFRNTSGPELISLINGRLYNLRPEVPTGSILDITPGNETRNYVSRNACMVAANNFLVVQDGLSSPIVYTGFSSYRSNRILDPSESYVELSCTIGANNPRISMASTAGLFPGMLVLASRGIQANTIIVSVDSATELTLSKNCTLTGLGAVKFYPPGQLQIDVSIPTGSVMAYGNGRLWVAQGNVLFAGDLSGSYSGAEIRFSENQYLSGGGGFSFETDITGLAFLPGSDTSTGQGDLIVFTRNSISAIRSNIFNRTEWQATQGMQRKLFLNGGAESQDSIIITNNDVYYKALDGVRSLRQTYQETKHANVTLADSIEANRVLSYETQEWIQYSPSIYFEERALHGCSPKIQKVYNSNTEYNIVFTKIVSQDFNPGVYEGNYPPVYDGEWTGLQVCKLISGVFDGKEKCYALVCGSDGHNALYQITSNDDFDTYLGDNSQTYSQPISSFVEMRRMAMESPFEIKELMRADLGFSEISGSLTWNFEFAPDYYPVFLQVQSGAVEFETQSQNLSSCSPFDLAPGYANIRTIKPPDSCVTGVNRKARFGYLFQPRISWTGSAKLTLFRLHASRKDISDLGEC
jgi:hypothetical protein